MTIQGGRRFSGNADVPVGSYVNADEDVGVPGKARNAQDPRRECWAAVRGAEMRGSRERRGGQP